MSYRSWAINKIKEIKYEHKIFLIEMLIQSVIFDKSVWRSPAACRAFLREHGFKYSKIHTTAKYYRFRQYDPKYDTERYVTHEYANQPGIKYYVALSKA